MASPQKGVVHITPRPRRQSVSVEHYSAILGSSVDDSTLIPPTEYFQTIAMTTSNLSEDGSFTIPESSQTVLEEQKIVLLKRRSSWRKFKDRVAGWVSGSGNPDSNDEECLIPKSSAPNTHPSLDNFQQALPKKTHSTASLVVEDAEALLKSTNCYSSGKKVTQQAVAGSPEIPTIVVTCDKNKSQEEEVRKKLAVAKIKEAITSMSSSEDVSNFIPGKTSPRCSESPTTPNSKRRHSAVYDNRRKNSADIQLSGRRGSGPNLRRSNSAKLGKPRPMIWEHFDVVPGNSTIGKCKECHMAVSCKYNTGQFVRHLQNSHKDIYRGYQSKMDSAWAKSVIERNLK